jgi:hypothetical protein
VRKVAFWLPGAIEIRSDTSSQAVGRETRWPASKEEILEEMVAKSSDIDFLKSDKASLKELTNSEFCETEEELD